MSIFGPIGPDSLGQHLSMVKVLCPNSSAWSEFNDHLHLVLTGDYLALPCLFAPSTPGTLINSLTCKHTMLP